ncbi:MAG TPA: ChbG/HpnK family deacetylase [Methylomusa anaerophila]|uniref:Hopanoid biosynthesis associated protein HpnK n=1 Tax=Methylomusa anaerophila TaxID=1930071 RepID=A0A348AQF1_9FIRM|nr:ChbG/HpnK family deacetylase [Methylomusa anaerophila]BBB93299.1 hypothetical protein MAMMFC1_04011 [Methylomusa anaerophila]HML86870.1 ChbG/HpnK family deacetylase [Methylomusa anaerophila]
MKRIIINADDFGLHECVNEAVILGHTSGSISSTSIMACGAAFEHAVSLTSRYPKLGVGVHLTLVAEYPVAPSYLIPSLVNQKGRMAEKYPVFLKQYLAGKIKIKDIYRELTAQVAKVLNYGVNITHLDSHQHMHVVPGIIEVVIDIAKEFNIPAIRIPAEPVWFFGGYKSSAGRIIGRTGLSFLSLLARRKVRKAGIISPDYFFGMLAGGKMEEKLLVNILKALPSNGVTEIMIHPGACDAILNDAYDWNFSWQAELGAAMSSQVKQILSGQNIELISFKDLT